ncbi:hypothetical protein [Streptomyces sp. NPDC058620]|uniref:hypothetical protein n=1 Tax=Streptomyces sp. NPDC058620 TaxID=3346560 RepID=UPI00366575D9
MTTIPPARWTVSRASRAQDALRFYRRAGWHQVPAPVPGRAGLTVLLGPRHPGRPDVSRPDAS